MNLGIELIKTVTVGPTLSFLNLLSVDVIGQTVRTTTTSIGLLISYFASIDQPNMLKFKKVLYDTNLDFKIDVLEELVKEQSDTNQRSVKKALMGVNDILIKIDTELKLIRKSFKNHQSKYLNYWRTFDCSCNIETILNHTEQLDDRSRILMKLLQIYQYKEQSICANELVKESDKSESLIKEKNNYVSIEDLA
jgi:hypothetical protein